MLNLGLEDLEKVMVLADALDRDRVVAGAACHGNPGALREVALGGAMMNFKQSGEIAGVFLLASPKGTYVYPVSSATNGAGKDITPDALRILAARHQASQCALVAECRVSGVPDTDTSTAPPAEDPKGTEAVLVLFEETGQLRQELIAPIEVSPTGKRVLKDFTLPSIRSATPSHAASFLPSGAHSGN